MKLTCFLFFFLLLAGSTFAQTNPDKVDVILMKNGDRHVGQIIEYEQGVQVVIRLKDGMELEIKDAQVLQILQGVAYDEERGVQTEDLESKKKLTPHSKGLYNSTLLSFAMGSGNGDGLALGAGISNIFGYQFKPAIGIGLGVGIDNYARRGETVYPVFAELRSYLPGRKNPWSYYAVLAGGYGFAFKKENIGISEADGGYLFHPAFGYRTSTKQGIDVNVDVGVKFQKASFTRDLFNGDIEIRDITYRRITVRVGLTLWKR